jgi:hypothetical protein
MHQIMLHLASAIATKTPSVYLLTKSVVTPELLSVRGCMVSEQKILLCKAQQEFTPQQLHHTVLFTCVQVGFWRWLG